MAHLVVDLVGVLLTQEVDNDRLVVFADEFERKGEIDRAAEVGDEQLQSVDEVVDDEMLPRFRRHRLYFLFSLLTNGKLSSRGARDYTVVLSTLLISSESKFNLEK